MSTFSLSFMFMISSWCAIRTSFFKWKKNFLKSSKWKILVTHISSLAWKWKGIVHNVFFTSTKLGISKRFLNAFAWRIAKAWECHLIPRQNWKRMKISPRKTRFRYGCWDGEGSLSTSYGILDVCHVVYLAGFGLSNKHGQSKPRTLDCGQTHSSILTRHFAIQITIRKITTPRFSWTLWCGLGDSMWQPKCNIIDEESHTTYSNKTHWCGTSFCSRMN